MLTRKRLLLLNQTDPNLLFEDLFNGAAVNANFWTKTDTYADEEQITNGTFTSDISGWTDASTGTGATAWNAGAYMDLTAGASGTAVTRQSTTAIAGHSYRLTVTKGGDAAVTVVYKLGTAAGGTQIGSGALSAGANTIDFTATSAATWVDFSTASPNTATIDTVSIKATTGLISVSGGNLDFAGGKTTPAWADPALVSVKSWARQAGLTIEWQVTPGGGGDYFQVGFTDGSLAASGLEAATLVAYGGTIGVKPNIAVILTPLAYSAAQVLWARIVLKATGAYYYVSTDSRVTWKLIWIDSTVTTTPLYAFIESYNAAVTASKVEVRQGSVKGAVLSASPSAPALTPGAELIVNGGFTAWTGDNPDSWTMTGTEDANNKVTENPAGKCQLVANGVWTGIRQGVPTVGTWYKIALDVDTVALGGITVAQYGVVNIVSYTTTGAKAFAYRPTNTEGFQLQALGAADVTVDNFSAKPLPFDQTGVLEYIGDAGVKAGVFDANITVAATYHAGFVVCADSATAPTYNLLAYVDRTAAKAYLLKNVNGTWTELVAAAITYSAGAQLRLIGVGSSWGLYYNGAICGTVQTVDVSSNYGSHCHAFMTSASETVAAFEVNP